jgi:hypothetical protein
LKPFHFYLRRIAVNETSSLNNAKGKNRAKR